DRERDTVEALADLRNGISVRRVNRELVSNRPGPVDEEANSVTAADLLGTSGVFRNLQGADDLDPFTRDAESLPTRGENSHVRTITDDAIHQPRDRSEDVLAVVDHQEELLAAQELEQQIADGDSGARIQAEDAGDGVRHGVSLAYSVELAQPRTVPVIGDQGGRDLEREARLSHAAHAGQGHERRVFELARDARQVGASPDERRHLARQVARERLQRPERRELASQLGVRQLRHDLGAAEVLQLVESEL